jgi:hypothetical protein
MSRTRTERDQESPTPVALVSGTGRAALGFGAFITSVLVWRLQGPAGPPGLLPVRFRCALTRTAHQKGTPSTISSAVRIV